MSSQAIAFPLGLILFVGLAIGAIVAFVIQESGTVTGRDDPCYGLGELVATHQYTVTENYAEVAQRDLGLDLTPGETREARDCRISEFEIGTIDGATGTGISLYTDWGAVVATSTARAAKGETPPNPALDAFATALQASFVTPEVPTDLTAGCDPSWVRTTLEGVEATLCHPSDWREKADDSPEGMVGTDGVEVAVLGSETRAHNTRCSEALGVETSEGTALVCAVGPSVYARVNYGIALPNGLRVAINVFNAATREQELTALQVAVNAESAR